MRTETVEHGGIVVIVGARVLRTTITEYDYTAKLEAEYPEVQALNNEVATVRRPRSVVKDDGTFETDKVDQARCYDELVPIFQRHAKGKQYQNRIELFVPRAARIREVRGGAFATNGIGFGSAELKAAFENFLNEEDWPLGGGIWSLIDQCIAEMDKPLAPLHQQLPAKVEEAVRPT